MNLNDGQCDMTLSAQTVLRVADGLSDQGPIARVCSTDYIALFQSSNRCTSQQFSRHERNTE
jgi:hypothetical protein